MESRPRPSPAEVATIPRPSTQRQRSNSFPIVDALGCSSVEATLLLAEGRAAVRSRQPSVRRGARRHRSNDHEMTTFRPQHHMHYLQRDPLASEETSEGPESNSDSAFFHSRIPSNLTDGSTSTIVAPIQPPAKDPPSNHTPPHSPLGDYSANLAKFIQTQLNSIPSYNSTKPMAPRSCPDLTYQSTPPLSPAPSTERLVEMPHILEMPPVRPPLRSAFSAWSSTDDEADQEVPPLSELEPPRRASAASSYTPSILKYYDGTSAGSFLLTSTPLEEEQSHPNVDGFSFPIRSPTAASQAAAHSSENKYDSRSSASQSHFEPTESSAPSFSSTSTASYFDYKRPISFSPHPRDQIIAAVTPPHQDGKNLTAISPFDGAAITRVHDVLVESQNSITVEGTSFDLLRDFRMPDQASSRLSTPC